METTIENSLVSVALGNSPVYYIVPVFGGAYLVNRLPAVLPDDLKQRDVVLSLFPYVNGAFGNMLNVAIGDVVSQGYSLKGDPSLTIQARILLDHCGLSQLTVASLRDYACSRQGAWLKVSQIEGRSVWIEHLDSLRVEHTGNDDIPVLYCTQDGEYRELAADEVINLSAQDCWAERVFHTISDETPYEMFFVDGLTVDAIRDSTRDGMIQSNSKLFILILPETPFASEDTPIAFSASIDQDQWRKQFSEAINTHVLQGHVEFSFIEIPRSVNLITGQEVPGFPPINLTITMPAMTLPQMIVNMPAQEPMRVSFEPQQIVVNVPPQPAPVVNVEAAQVHVPPQPAPIVQVMTPEQPTPIVNIQQPKIDVSVEAPQVNVAAPNVTVEVPTVEEEIIDIQRNQDGYITQARKKRKVKK